MRLAISQPTYLPWLGYFDLIDQVDGFVFLDSVQFEKRSWQQRNRIKGPQGHVLLTVPVLVAGRFEQTIQDVEISSATHCDKHKRSIEMCYRRTPFFAEIWPDFSAVFETFWRRGHLSELNMTLIRWCLRKLGIDKRLYQSSCLPCVGNRGELLAKICEHLGADQYLSVPGSAGYLVSEEEAFKSRGIQIQFQNFEHPVYEQLFPPFLSHTSLIDLLFNHGSDALSILQRGRRCCLSVEQMKRACAETVKA